MNRPIIEVSDLGFTYPDGTEAFSQLSFEVEQGETIGLVGPNGAGKSTLLLHLNGVLPWSVQGRPTHSGRITVAGVELSRKTVSEVRQKVGLLFQDPDDQVFCSTVLEDVAFGPKHLLNDRDPTQTARDCLKRLELDPLANRNPQRLSYGEKKRVGLAGVLACRPQVMVLDEPSSNLDPRARRDFISLIQSLDCTKIVATHDLELVLEICERVWLMSQGRLIASGPAAEILSDEQLLQSNGLELPLSVRLRREIDQTGGSRDLALPERTDRDV